MQDLWTDDQDKLWVLDSSPGSKVAQGQFKLMEFNLATNKLIRTYDFENPDKTKSALNDVRIDHLPELACPSDPSLCAIVVLDL